MTSGSIEPRFGDPSTSFLYQIIGLKFKRNLSMVRIECSAIEGAGSQGQ
jgi:hypothetical protein